MYSRIWGWHLEPWARPVPSRMKQGCRSRRSSVLCERMVRVRPLYKQPQSRTKLKPKGREHARTSEVSRTKKRANYRDSEGGAEHARYVRRRISFLVPILMRSCMHSDSERPAKVKKSKVAVGKTGEGKAQRKGAAGHTDPAGSSASAPRKRPPPRRRV